VVNRVAFSPDGTRLFSVGSDGVKVWDATTGMEVLALRGHTSYVLGLALSPSGTRIASGSNDQTVKIWDARPGNPEEVREEREALGLLEFLFAKPLRKADVIDYLHNGATLRPQARQLALSLVDRYREETDPEKYHQASRALVCQPSLNVFQYRFALKQVETACRLAPDNDVYRRTLELAHSRIREKEESPAKPPNGQE
jgi:hypothetical protein